MRAAALIVLVACGSQTPAPSVVTAPVVADAAVAIVPDASTPDAAPVRPQLTATEFQFVEPSKLQPITSAALKPLATPRVVRFAINTWVGWAPILYANDGRQPKKVWKDARGTEFLLELVLADDPGAMTRSFAAGGSATRSRSGTRSR